MYLVGFGGFSNIRDRVLRGSIVSTLLWLAWPVIANGLFQSLYSLVDAFWLGKLGKAVFSAPVVCWPYLHIVISLGMGFSTAAVSYVSQYFGAGDRESTALAAAQALSLALLSSAVIAVASFLAAPPFFAWLGIPPDVYPLALKYLATILIGAPFMFGTLTCLSVVNALGNTRVTLKVNVISSVTNMVLDPVLIFGFGPVPGFGVVGAAAATVLARSLAFVLSVRELLRAFHTLNIRLRPMLFFPKLVWCFRLLKVGVPTMVQESANSLGFTVMTGIVSGFGSTILAAYGACTRVFNLMDSVTFGISRAMSIMVGQCVGAGFVSRAKKVVAVGTAILFTYLIAASATIYVFRYQLIAMFISDPQVIAAGARMIELFWYSMPFFGIFFAARGVAGGSGHVASFTIIPLIRLWGIRVPLSYYLAYVRGMGPDGIWLGMAASNIVAGFLALAWVRRARWTKGVIHE